MRCFLRTDNYPIEGILIDMDGVLYHGDTPIADAFAFMETIADIPHCFITNNPIKLPEQIVEKMARMGFSAPDIEQIITSGEATAQWLNQQKPNFRYFAIGAEGLHKSLQKYGTEDMDDADYVVIGEGAGIDYQTLSMAINLIIKGQAQLISTNPDNTVDATRRGEHWILPGGGALVAPVIAATGVKPTTIGKPYPLLYEMALKRINLAARDCLMIGDRPDTDIQGAASIGMRTALVRTGRFLPGEKYPDNLYKPDIDNNSLTELLELIQA
ncbi:MAG: HAD-IIA family hydrolase [Gammaproteobacteria bacterium]|nr:HAD-IIA family hydrolase [Gammaproteobacteria bacterium]